MGRFFGPGTLALAGAVSGAGNAAEKGLASAQNYVQQDALQQARDEMDMKRLQLQEQYAGAREQRGYAHTETENAASRAHAETLHGQSEAGADARTGMQITSQESIHDQDRTAKAKESDATNALKGRELDQKGSLEGRKLDIEQKHYADWYKVFSQKAEKGTATKEDWKGAELYVGVIKENIQGLNKRLEQPGLSADEQKNIEKKIKTMTQQVAAITRVGGMETPTIIDPNDTPADKPGAEKKTAAAATPAPVNRPDRIIAPAQTPISAADALSGGASAALSGAGDTIRNLIMPNQAVPPAITLEPRRSGTLNYAGR